MRFKFKKVDFLFTEAYYTQPGDQPVKVKCGNCGGSVIFTKEQDDPKDWYHCINSSTSSTNRCFNKRRFEIDAMYPPTLACMLETQYSPDEAQEPVVIELATDGVSRFHRERKMTYDERHAYYEKALDHLRAKMARGG